MQRTKLCFAITRKEGICDPNPKRFYDRIEREFREVAAKDTAHHFPDNKSAMATLKKVAEQSHGGLMQVVPVVVSA